MGTNDCCMNTDTADIWDIAGYPVLATTQPELASMIYQRISHHQKTLLFYANTNLVVQCKPLREALQQPEVIIVNDGIGMDIASMMLYGRKFKSNLNGTDFTPYLLQHSPKPLRVFLLGGRPQVVRQAAQYVQNVLGQQVVGTCDGYAGMQNEVNLVGTINATQADVLLVAMGNPLQEDWALKHFQALHVPVISGVGALFDFWAGNKPRAPKLVQQIRMEWFYRLCLEPKRLIKRYSVDIATFLMCCLKDTRKPRK